MVPEYANARYLPGKDTPKYGDNLGPHCYAVPFKGITLNDGTTPLSGTPAASGTGVSTRSAQRHPQAAPKAIAATTAAATALAGSPMEGELVRELAGLATGRPASSVPAWSSLLLAPLFRGAHVSLVTRS